MHWGMQLAISIIVPIISSILTYVSAIKKAKSEVEAVKIKAENEIKKVREESEKDLKRIQKETDEQIRLEIAKANLSSQRNEQQLKMDAAATFMKEFMNDPQKSAQKLKKMQDVAKSFGMKN